MALVSYDPWGTLTKLHDEVNRAFQNRMGAMEHSDNSSVANFAKGKNGKAYCRRINLKKAF